MQPRTLARSSRFRRINDSENHEKYCRRREDHRRARRRTAPGGRRRRPGILTTPGRQTAESRREECRAGGGKAAPPPTRPGGKGAGQNLSNSSESARTAGVGPSFRLSVNPPLPRKKKNGELVIGSPACGA